MLSVPRKSKKNKIQFHLPGHFNGKFLYFFRKEVLALLPENGGVLPNTPIAPK